MVKENAQLIVDGLELTKEKNDSSNRLLFEKIAAQFREIHGITPKQAITKYQTVLDELSLTLNSRDQEREKLSQLSQQNSSVTEKALEEHLSNHAKKYQEEQTVNPAGKISRWFNQAINVCSGYKNSFFSLGGQQLSKVNEIKNKAAKMDYETKHTIAQMEAADQSWYKQLQETQLWAANLPEDNPSKKRFIIFINKLLKQEEEIRTGQSLSTNMERNQILEDLKSDRKINSIVNDVSQEQDIADSSCKTKTDAMIARLTAMNDPLSKKQFLEKATKDSKIDSKTDIIVPSLTAAQAQLHKTQVNKR